MEKEPAAQLSNDELDLYQLFRVLWCGRWWIAVAVVIFTTAFSVAAFVITPVYRATVVLIPASSDRDGLSGALGSAFGQLSGLASLAGVNVDGGDAATEEALAVLKSRRFTEEFIRNNDLLYVLLPKRSGAYSWPWDAPATYARANKYFDRKIRKIVQDKKTGLITLQIDWTDRQLAASWANKLVERLNVEMRSRAINKAILSIRYLEKELNTTVTVEARESVNRLVEAQIKQRMLANVTREYAFRVVDGAVSPDQNEYIYPKRLAMILTGFSIGLILAIACLLLRNYFVEIGARRKQREMLSSNRGA